MVRQTPYIEFENLLRAALDNLRLLRRESDAAMLESIIDLLSAAHDQARAPDSEWLTTREAADLTRRPLSTVQWWCRHAERLGLRVQRLPGGGYLIHRESLLKQDSAGRDQHSN